MDSLRFAEQKRGSRRSFDPRDPLLVEQNRSRKEAAESERLDLAVKAQSGFDRENKVKAIKSVACFEVRLRLFSPEGVPFFRNSARPTNPKTDAP
jgi:hypothetical protein